MTTDHRGPDRPGTLHAIGRILGTFGDVGGYVAAGIMLLLAVSVMLGITLRALGIDNSWTYDLDTFALVWLAFFGAALTALRGGHVTSGVALENLFTGDTALRVLATLRFIIVVGFLIVFAVSSLDQAQSSFATHETTLDIVQWPVWIAKAALPLGTLFWLIAEVHKFIKRISPQP